MVASIVGRTETAAHLHLKRLALVWAQAHRFSACAMEVHLPRCRYRADLAAYRVEKNGLGSTAIFECKQAAPDLRRDNCATGSTRHRVHILYQRRQILEKHLRVHYPKLRISDTLFPEFDSHDFAAIQHRGYVRVVRELNALRNRLHGCTKFDKLIRYRCANLCFLVLPRELFRHSEVPEGWGALVETNDSLSLIHKPSWQEITFENRLLFLQRIAMAGTRILNRQLEITFDDVLSARGRSCD